MATLHSPICGTVCTCSSHRTLSLTTLIKLPSLFPDHEIKIRNENMVFHIHGNMFAIVYVCVFQKALQKMETVEVMI